MATSMPIRIDEELYDSAKVVGASMSRSATQQVAHWARIGRELESSRSISTRDVAAVLAGEVTYDDVGTREQAVVRPHGTKGSPSGSPPSTSGRNSPRPGCPTPRSTTTETRSS